VNSPGKKLALVAALTVIVVAVLYFVFRRGDADLALNQPDARKKTAGANVEADPEYIIVGGVRRKASDVKASTPPSASDLMDRIDVGKNKPVSIDANPQVRSVAEALRSDEHPERLSPLARPASFDANGFEADPQTYLDTIEPGRVFQTAQPGPGVEVLHQISPRHISIRQGEKTKLRVKAVAGAPVTFKSFDLGRFENELTTISVMADGEGFAEVEFFGSPGTYNNVNILAGSPLTTGQAKFVVFVEVPRPTAATAK